MKNTPDLAPQTGSENRVAWARMSPRPRWLVLVKINESVMKKSKTPHDVPTYGPNDHLGHAANAKHEADWCVRNGDHDRAWGFYHEQQNRYLLHTTKRGSAFTPEATAAPARRFAKPRPRRGTVSPLPIRWTSLSGPAKRTPTGALWRERWRSAPCPAATLETGSSTSASTAPSRWE